MSAKLFISTVTNEFKKCRVRLSEVLRSPDVVAENQEEYIATHPSGHSILIKLDDFIKDCHAVIHLIGKQTSKDGSPAEPEAIDDLLIRYPDFSTTTGLTEAALRNLSYTQWEAWLAYYHIKTTRPRLKLLIATPKAEFHPDNPPHPGSAFQQEQSQAWHQKELQSRVRYSEIEFGDDKDLSIAALKALKNILPASQPNQKIHPTRLVSRHTSSDFLGRESELALLDKAWVDSPVVNHVSIIAWGGVGKTALLAHWVQTRFIEKAWKGADGNPEPLFYFDWTFYDQGTRADDETQAGAASVDGFFEAALKFFGDPESNLPGKGSRLASLVQKHRSLIVLDGLEPLQYPFNHPQAGLITDLDLRDFLAALASQNPGLCIVSSRLALADLSGLANSTAPSHDLNALPEEIAIRLLQKMQVKGSDEDLKQAARDYAGHALSLIILGRYIFQAKGGDIRKRDSIPLEKANSERTTQTRNAWHILETYEQWLSSPKGRPEDQQALLLTGLFDRPATPDCLDVLRTSSSIPGLTDLLGQLDNDQWNLLLNRLHNAHLIQLCFPSTDPRSASPNPEPRELPIDVHPLIREYFAKHLRDKHPESFMIAHSRLFDHLCESTEHQPDTLEGLQPLYQAVIHGCLANRHPEAREKVYRDRILRDTSTKGFYSTKKLGAFGADLGALTAFFEQPWREISASLNTNSQAWLLSITALRLRALGRLTESLEPIRVSIGMAIRDKKWKSAANRTSNLSQVETLLGRLEDAISNARRAINFADRSENTFRRMINYTTAADALHQCGKNNEARQFFEQAEILQSSIQPEFKLLRSVRGFRFCSLILAPAERAAWQTSHSGNQKALASLSEAEHRADLSLKWAICKNQGLLTIAADHLTLAQICLYRSIISPDPSLEYSNPHIQPALSGLRNAGTIHHLPKALLTAALHHHVCGEPVLAHRHLDEAHQIAERGPMPLYLADVHLHRARLFRDNDELTKARTLIKKHGYWRRKEELEDAETASENW